jgi:hypothetical protein
MLANHTGINTLFKRIVGQYDRLRKRNAFLEQYKREEPFRDGLGEFDSAREVVMELIGEYEEAEKASYLSGPDEGDATESGADGRTDGVTGRWAKHILMATRRFGFNHARKRAFDEWQWALALRFDELDTERHAASGVFYTDNVAFAHF